MSTETDPIFMNKEELEADNAKLREINGELCRLLKLAQPYVSMRELALAIKDATQPCDR